MNMNKKHLRCLNQPNFFGITYKILYDCDDFYCECRLKNPLISSLSTIKLRSKNVSLQNDEFNLPLFIMKKNMC